MGRTPKRSREEISSKIEQHRLQAKRRAVELLKNCLDNHLLTEEHSADLISQACKSLGIPPLSFSPALLDAAPDSNDKAGKKSKGKSQVDEHNEVCEVCERGGDLLCCDTCSLVFHLKCLRPKMANVPKGEWSCAYCILDDTATGDKKAAKQAIRMMTRLAHGLDVAEHGTPASTAAASSSSSSSSTGEVDSSYRLGKAGEITIAHTGRKFIVRKRARKQIEELGRFATLTEALCTIPAVRESISARKRMSNVEPSENDDLWCAFCLDDPSVEICAFCGCKKCYGKFDPDLLILCDHCERETHCYCMEPPLAGIPDEDPWYCEACKVDIDQDEETQHKTHVEEKKEVKMPSPSSQPLTTTDSLQSQYEEGHQTPTKDTQHTSNLMDSANSADNALMNSGGSTSTQRARGRPPGSKKKDSTPTLPDFNTVVASSSAAKSEKTVPNKSAKKQTKVGNSGSKSKGKHQPEEFVRKDVDVNSSERIVQRIEEFKERPVSVEDVIALANYRKWSKIKDLDKGMKALISVRDQLLQRFSEIAPSAAQAMINEYNIQNLPFTIDPSLCHQEMAQEQEDVELLDIDAEELARDRLVTNTDSPFLLNFDLDNHHLDAMDVPTA